MPDGDVRHTVVVVTGTVVGGMYAVVGTTVVTGGVLEGRVVVVSGGVVVGVGVAIRDSVVEVVGAFLRDVVRATLTLPGEPFVPFAPFPLAPPELALERLGLPPRGAVSIVDGVALFDGRLDWLAANSFAAFAACATNIPVATPELKKMAWVRSLTRANFFATG